MQLHPQMPPLRIARLERQRPFVAHAAADAEARAAGRPWAEVSWLFFVEPLGERRSRLISRFRCAGSDDLATRIRLGRTLLEPIGFAMDRRMLLGVKRRVEARANQRPMRSFVRTQAGRPAPKEPRVVASH